MSQAYSDASRASDPYALPDVEVFQLTAEEVAVLDEETVYDYMKRPEFKLASMSSRVRARMIDTMIDELGITGGWFYWFCFPGCLPDSEPIGPFPTKQDALNDAQSQE